MRRAACAGPAALINVFALAPCPGVAPVAVACERTVEVCAVRVRGAIVLALRALVCVDRKRYRRDRDEQYHEDQAAHADADQPREVRLVAPIPLRGRDLLADLIDGLLPAWPGLPLRGALLPHQRGPRAADQALVIVDTKDANVCMLHAHSSQSSSRRHYGSWMGAPTTELVVRPCGQSGLPATAAA